MGKKRRRKDRGILGVKVLVSIQSSVSENNSKGSVLSRPCFRELNKSHQFAQKKIIISTDNKDRIACISIYFYGIGNIKE